MNNALLWKRLGLNRAIGDEGGQPQITSSKKKGESTVYLIKLPPQPHYYIPLNYLPAAGDKDSDEPSGAKKAISTPDPFETVLAVAAATARYFTFFFFFFLNKTIPSQYPPRITIEQHLTVNYILYLLD